MIRIARILGRPNVGGPARTALRLCRALPRDEFETLLVVGNSDPEEGDLLANVDDVRIERVPSMRRSIGFHDFAARRALEAILREFRPAIVHTHAAKAGALGRRAAFAAVPDAKVVHTYHGHSLRGYFPRPIAALFASIERRLARRTDRLIAVSATVKRELAVVHRIAPAERIEVIDNGIDLSPFPTPTRERSAAARSRLAPRDPAAAQILVPARLVPIKGHLGLFESLDGVRLDGRSLEVHLVGDGPSRSELESAAAKLPARVIVRFHGFRSDLPELLPGADLVVLPSKNEGMSLALIEAMAAGCAIVATSVGGTPDLITHDVTGILVPGDDPRALAEGISRALSDNALRGRLGAAARERALARHSIERVVDQHARLYRDLVGSSAGTLVARAVDSGES